MCCSLYVLCSDELAAMHALGHYPKLHACNDFTEHVYMLTYQRAPPNCWANIGYNLRVTLDGRRAFD